VTYDIWPENLGWCVQTSDGLYAEWFATQDELVMYRAHLEAKGYRLVNAAPTVRG
jgi:hypothetical protein